MDQQKRPSWDEYFMEIAMTVAKRATCDRGRSGCVIARDKRILTTGYVGAPAGLPHCDEVGHLIKTTIHEDGSTTKHCLRTTHAEMNAICQAAQQGISIKDATIYCNMIPCRTCAMSLINCGIKKVVARKNYHAGEESIKILEEAGVEVQVLTDELQTYEQM